MLLVWLKKIKIILSLEAAELGDLKFVDPTDQKNHAQVQSQERECEHLGGWDPLLSFECKNCLVKM